MARDLTTQERITVDSIEDVSIRDRFAKFLSYSNSKTADRRLELHEGDRVKIGGTVTSGKKLTETGEKIEVDFDAMLPLTLDEAVFMFGKDGVLFHVWNDRFSTLGTKARRDGTKPVDDYIGGLEKMAANVSVDDLERMIAMLKAQKDARG